MRRTPLTVTTLAAALVVIVTTVSLGALGVANYLADRNREWQHLRSEGVSKVEELSAALALPLWNFDSAQVEKVIESQMGSPNVQAVVVRQAHVSAPGGVVTYARVRDDGGKVRAVREAPSAEGLLVEERLIATKDGDPLGSVRVYMTPRRMQANLRISLYRLVWVIVLLDALLSASLYSLLWWTVLKPLKEIEQYAGAVRSEAETHESTSESVPPASPGRRYVCQELRSLRGSIEHMVRLLHDRLVALRKKEIMLSTVLDSVPHSIFWKDARGVYLGGNAALAETVGVQDAREIVGKTDFDLPGLREGAEAYRADDQEVMAANRPKRHIVERVLHADGTHRWLETTKVPLVDADGVLCGVLGVAEDVTERKEAEEALRREKALTDAIFESMPGMLYMYDDQGRLLRWNGKARGITGDTDENLRQSHMGDYQPAEDRDRILAAAHKVMREGEAVVEGHMMTTRGLVPYYFTGVRAMIDGRPHLIGIGVDISERKRVEEALLREKALTDAVFDNAPALLFLYDDTGRMVRWNSKSKEITGHTDADFANWQIGDGVPAEEKGRVAAAVRQVLEKGHAVLEATFVTKSGDRRIPFFVTGVRLMLDGRPHLLVIGVDVTEQKRAEEHLRRALEQAEAANRAKDQFLAAASHELRTPLTPVLLLTSSLEADPHLSPEAREDLAVIREHVEVERRLIGDLLDFTAIHAGKLHVHPVPTDVHDVLRAAVRTCEEDADRKGLRIELRLEAKHHSTSGDPDRLRQVFWNLLQNACKFTPEHGAITIRTSDEADGHTLRVEVSDTGRGMDAETLRRLFRPFEQGPRDARMQHYGGLGLGLAIAKALVEAHGGSISATSEGPDRGSAFIVRLPVTADVAVAEVRPAAQPAPPAAAAGSARPRLLLVEDHPLTLKTLGRLLAAEGYEVTTETTVEGALRAAGERAFDLVVSDIGLPDGSGLELMPVLRDRYGLSGIALSGYGSDGDVEASRRAGFLAHLTKPVTMEALREALARFAVARAEHAPSRTVAG